MANRECSIQRTQNNLDTRTASGYIKNLKKGKMHHKQIMDFTMVHEPWKTTIVSLNLFNCTSTRCVIVMNDLM